VVGIDEGGWKLKWKIEVIKVAKIGEIVGKPKGK
jgi:hypothetical protein